ncbi:hypothetical protein JCM10207_003058 [Rhodosporidiobolus poonsookiae]
MSSSLALKQQRHAHHGSGSPPALASLTALPREVLASIVAFVAGFEDDEDDEDGPASLALLSLTSTTFRKLALPFLFDSLQLKDSAALVKAVKVFKLGGKGKKKSECETSLAFAGELSVEFENVYSSPPTKTTLVSSLASILSSAASLTSLSISLGSPSSQARHSLLNLFPSFPAPLDVLTNLEVFRLSAGAEIWLHDLARLFPSWPHLHMLELAHLRGDGSRPLASTAVRPTSLKKLVVGSSSLTGEMVAWLLDGVGTSGLEWLEMPLPGADGHSRAWKAVEKVMGRKVEVLKLTDGWAGGTVRRKKKVVEVGGASGSDGATGENDGGSDIFKHPPSPLLPLLVKTPNLRSLLLTTALLPSVPSSESFETLLEHLDNLAELTIEDTAASGLRKAVQAALAAGKLPALERVVSVGVKKRKGAGEGDEAKKGKGDKAFDKACEKRGVEWTIVSA